MYCTGTSLHVQACQPACASLPASLCFDCILPAPPVPGGAGRASPHPGTLTVVTGVGTPPPPGCCRLSPAGSCIWPAWEARKSGPPAGSPHGGHIVRELSAADVLVALAAQQWPPARDIARTAWEEGDAMG